MLGKLLKHEWKATRGMCGLMIAVLFGMTILGMLGTKGFTRFITVAERPTNPLDGIFLIFGLMVLFLYVIAIFAVSIGIYVYMGVRFNANMFGSEGYLTHTLPVKKSSLLVSKLIVDSLVVILVTIIMYVSIVVLAFSFIPGKGILELMSEFAKNYQEIVPKISEYLGFDLTAYLIFVGLGGLFGSVLGLAIMYGCVCIGQLFGKAKLLMFFVSYFGVMLVIAVIRSAIGNLFQANFALNILETENFRIAGFFYTQLFLNLGIQVFMAIVMYLISLLILNKKLNLQ